MPCSLLGCTRNDGSNKSCPFSAVQRVCTTAVAAYGAYTMVSAVFRLIQDSKWPFCKGLKRDEMHDRSMRLIRERESKFMTPEVQKVFSESLCRGVEGNRRDYQKGATALTKLFSNGVFSLQDLLRESSDKLFWLHSNHATISEGGHGVRFTVQCNLFGGSIAGLGNANQQKQLHEIYSSGELGCFALTEIGAGVLSGLIVESTATWTNDGFVINSPTRDSCKTWISNGLVAKWAVVVAKLLVPRNATNATFERKRKGSGDSNKEVDLGPHVFLVNLEDGRRTGQVVAEEMPEKIAFNSLDNAILTFSSFVVPHDSLLSRFCEVRKDGTYCLVDPKVPFRFEQMAQRLLSGRIAIAWASIAQIHSLVEKLSEIERKIITGPGTAVPLPQLPITKALLDATNDCADVFRVYVEVVERRFRTCAEPALKHQVPLINAAKILVLSWALDSVHKLKKRMGAITLQQDSPFRGAEADVLHIYSNAEGCVNILAQKTTRDLLSSAKGAKLAALCMTAVFGSGLRRRYACALLWLMRQVAFCSPDQQRKRWLQLHETVEFVAHAHCVLLVRDTVMAECGHSPQLATFEKLYVYHQ